MFRRPVPFAVVGAAPVLTAGHLGGLEHQIVPFAVRIDLYSLPLVRLAAPVHQLDSDGGRIVRLHAQADGGEVLRFQVAHLLDRRDVGAAAGEVAGQLQARLPRGRLVFHDRERTLGAGKLFAAAEAPVVFALGDLVQADGRLDLGAGRLRGTGHDRDVIDPERANLYVLVLRFAQEQVDRLGRPVPSAVLGAAPRLVAGHSGDGVRLAASCEEALQREDHVLPAGKRFRLEDDLVRLAAGVAEAQRELIRARVADPQGQLAYVHVVDLPPGLHVVAALGEVAHQLEAVASFPPDVGVERQLTGGAGKLRPVVEAPGFLRPHQRDRFLRRGRRGNQQNDHQHGRHYRQGGAPLGQNRKAPPGGDQHGRSTPTVLFRTAVPWDHGRDSGS